MTLRPDADRDTDRWAEEIADRIDHPAGQEGMDYVRSALAGHHTVAVVPGHSTG